MVGSLGRLGVLVELSFKVFPAPIAHLTGIIACNHLADGLEKLIDLTLQPFEFEALELESDGAIFFRIGGAEEALGARLSAIAGASEMEEDEAADRWRRRVAVHESAAPCLVKVPLSPTRARKLDDGLASLGLNRYYSAGANVCYVEFSQDAVEPLSELLTEVALSGLVLRGDKMPPRIGRRPSQAMEEHVKAALDPTRKFPPLPSTAGMITDCQSIPRSGTTIGNKPDP